MALEAASAIQAFLWVGLFGVLIATLTARLARPNNKSTIVPLVAVRKGVAGVLLEFRLVVHPSPPLAMPTPFVTLNIESNSSERENIPLEVERIQVPYVRYYLVFRALLPSQFLRPANDILAQIPWSTIDVFVRATDQESEREVLVHGELALPRQARVGRFVDAVSLDSNGRIVSLQRDKLSMIQASDRAPEGGEPDEAG